MRPSVRRATAVLLAALPFLLGWSAATPGPGFVSFAHETMATSIQLELPDTPGARQGADAVFAVFDSVDTEMSEWKPTSTVSAINRSAGGAPVRVSAGLLEVLAVGREIGERSSGAFDVTWAALWGVWDFVAVSPRVPPPEAIDRALARVNYRKLEIDHLRGTVRLSEPGMKIGLGGIAKGYALKRSAAVLRERGIHNFILSAGGQVYAGGRKGDRRWVVGIRDPRGAPDDHFALVEVHDASMSTSGDYERFFIKDGARYHHILDPRTGRPAAGLRSATVVASDPVLADALSTAALVLGPAAAMDLVRSYAGTEAILVDNAGGLHISAGLSQRLRLERTPRTGDSAAPGARLDAERIVR